MVKVDLSSLSKKNINATEKVDVTGMLQVNEFGDINNYLLSKGREILEVDGNNNIALGKIYLEVNEKLAGNNKYNGFWIKWLEALGQNRMTASRYINRYKVYGLTSNENVKLLIKVCSHDIISSILKLEDPKNFLNKLETITLKEFKEKVKLLSLKEKEDPNDHVLIPVEFAEEYKIFTRKIKNIDLGKLKGKDIEKIHKLIERFNKIIDDK